MTWCRTRSGLRCSTSRSQRDAVHEYGHTGSNQKSTTLVLGCRGHEASFARYDSPTIELL